MVTTKKWTIDPGHSKLQFKVRHLAITNVTGSFKNISGTVETATDASDQRTNSFDQATVSFEINTASIDTNNFERDNHLRSDLFLDAAAHPRIVFSGLLKATDDGHTLDGHLTLHGVTRPVTLQVEHTGIGAGRFNEIRAGFELTGKINRKDFGLSFNLRNDAGNLVVGEEIKLQGDIELIREQL